jgi:quercetin dioxygenase-like cupin family protein
MLDRHNENNYSYLRIVVLFGKLKLRKIDMKSSNRLLVPLLFFSLFSTAAFTAYADEKEPLIIPQSDLKWVPLPGMPKGAQITILQGDLKSSGRYSFLLKLPDGYVIPAHWHSNDEETTVISGALGLGIGDKIDKSEAKTLKPGSFAVVPGHMHHYVYATGETIIQDAGVGPRDTIFVNPDELKALIEKNK